MFSYKPTGELAQCATLRNHAWPFELQKAWAAPPLQLCHAHATSLVYSGRLHSALATVLGGHPIALSCPCQSNMLESPCNWDCIFTNDNFLFRDWNPATCCQASLLHEPFSPRVFTTIEAALSHMASSGLLHFKPWLLSMTLPILQVWVLCGRCLYITKFGCKLEVPS